MKPYVIILSNWLLRWIAYVFKGIFLARMPWYSASAFEGETCFLLLHPTKLPSIKVNVGDGCWRQ